MMLCYGLGHCLFSLQLSHEVEEKILFLYELKLKLTLNLWTVNKFFPEKAGFAEIIKKVSSLTLVFYIHPAGLEVCRTPGRMAEGSAVTLPASLACFAGKDSAEGVKGSLFKVADKQRKNTGRIC